jgi:transposase
MPAKREPMRKIKEVLRLKFEAGLSHERIAAAVGVSKGAVTNYVQRAAQAGLSAPLSPDLDEVALEALLFPHAPPRATSYAAPDFATIHQELKRKGVTLALLWEEYSAAHPEGAYRYSQFCWHYQRFRDGLKRSMRQVHRAGDKLFIDYSGDTLPVIDATTGEVRRAQLFIAVLGASNYTYAEATWTQQLPDWIGSHIRAFEFLGSVPALLVPDYVAGHIIRVMCLPPLCGRRRVMPRVVLGGSRACGNITGYRAFNQSRRVLSSFQTALLRPPAEVAQAGSHARKAAALARSVNSA